jgi:hypothetical protein
VEDLAESRGKVEAVLIVAEAEQVTTAEVQRIAATKAAEREAAEEVAH